MLLTFDETLITIDATYIGTDELDNACSGKGSSADDD